MVGVGLGLVRLILPPPATQTWGMLAGFWLGLGLGLGLTLTLTYSKCTLSQGVGYLTLPSPAISTYRRVNLFVFRPLWLTTKVVGEWGPITIIIVNILTLLRFIVITTN